MSSERHASVWDALEAAPAEAENLRIRAALMAELTAYLKRSGMTQAQAARQFSVTQPRISDLTRGKIDLFSIDTLVNMITAAGLHLDIRVRAPADPESPNLPQDDPAAVIPARLPRAPADDAE